MAYSASSSGIVRAEKADDEMPIREYSRARGFTLNELIVVMAIVGTMAAIAVPYMGGVMRRSRLESATREIYVPLLRARLEAIKRGSNVNVEYSTSTGKTAYQTAVIYKDNTGGGTTNAYDSTDTLIGEFPTAPAPEMTVRIDDTDKASPSTASQTIEFIFTPLGSMDTANSTSKSVYVGDAKNNLIQIRIPTSTNGKPIMTKQLSGTTYEAQPWQWY